MPKRRVSNYIPASSATLANDLNFKNPPRTPRLVRRAPLLQRIKASLDPYDLLLWLSEELNDDAYEDLLNEWATPVGIGLNILFVLARGASKRGSAGERDDVFGDARGNHGSGWFTWLAATLVHFLTLICCVNALYAFFRKRSYRLFEHSVEVAPPTPSAQRVRVDSSPASSSPLRYMQHVIAQTTASSRAYPDAEREVWEVNVWDPKPFNLTIFTLFSPGHILLYYSLLPPTSMDPRPSVTTVTAVAYGILLSLQLIFLKKSFSQQSKDTALIHGEVMNEYDTKFVHPSLNRPVRDVGTQTRESTLSPRGPRTREVDVYTPTTIVNRGFRVNPNPNYVGQYDPDNLLAQPSESRRNSGFSTNTGLTPSMQTPMNGYLSTANTQSSYSRGFGSSVDFSSPLKPHHERLRERSPVKGDGGNLGVYSHAASPLRKAASSNALRTNQVSELKKESSPLKRISTPGSSGEFANDRGRRRETGRF